MPADSEIEAKMDKAESEIKEILDKYDMYLGMLYDEGVATTLIYHESRPDGAEVVWKRETTQI